MHNFENAPDEVVDTILYVISKEIMNGNVSGTGLDRMLKAYKTLAGSGFTYIEGAYWIERFKEDNYK